MCSALERPLGAIVPSRCMSAVCPLQTCAWEMLASYSCLIEANGQSWIWGFPELGEESLPFLLVISMENVSHSRQVTGSLFLIGFFRCSLALELHMTKEG